MHDLMLPLGILCAIGLGMLLARVRASTRLAVAAFLAIPQFYVPGLPMPLAQAFLVLLAMAALLGRRPEPAGQSRGVPGLLLTVLLAVMSLLSVQWSSNHHEATTAVLRLTMFAGVLWTAIAAARESESLERAAKWAAPWVAIEAVLVIWFRTHPAAEASFYLSDRTHLFLGSAGRSLYTTAPNNVLDPAKAGGFFVNGNVASMFLGVAAVIYFIGWRLTGRRSAAIVSLLSYGAVFFTGSKTGLALAIGTVGVGLFVRFMRDRAGSGRLAVFVLVAIPVGALLFKQLSTVETASAHSYGERQGIWSAAADLFHGNVLLGLGYGGWIDRTASYLGGLPPHNLIVAAWANAGVAASALTVAYILRMAGVSMRSLRSAPTPELTTIAVAAGMGWMWILVHGMGDNTAIFGDVHSIVFAAMLTAHLIATRAGAPQNHSARRSPKNTGIPSTVRS